MTEVKLKEKRSDSVFIYEMPENTKCNVVIDKNLSAKIIVRENKNKNVLTLTADTPKPLAHYNALFMDMGFSLPIIPILDSIIIRWAKLLQLLTALDRLGSRDSAYINALCDVLKLDKKNKTLDDLMESASKELLKQLSSFEEYSDYANA